jgi:hypothetical protein
MCTVQLPPGGNTIAVNKNINTFIINLFLFTAHDLPEDGLQKPQHTAGALPNKYLWLHVKLVGLYCTVNTSTYIIHNAGRTILRRGNNISASSFSL